MKHGTEAKTDKKLGTLTVHYFGAGDQPPQDNTSQQFTFTHHFTVDKIDGHVVSDQGWTPSSHQYGYVQTPLITGYTSDKQQAGGQFVTYDNPDAWEEVVYTPIKAEKQRAIVTFVDDNTGITLMTKDLSGNAGTTDPYRTASDIKNYTDRGYVKVSDDYPVDGVVYDNDNETTQTFFVHLKHGTTSTSNDAKRTQTIIYTGMPDSLKPANNVQPLTFTHTIVKDSVDGHLISDSWTPAAQKYQDVVSPDVQGYTPNVSKVIGIEVNHQDPNRTIYVNYTPADNTQRAQIIYIDQTTGYTLHVYSATGQSNQPIDYHSAKDIKQFENNGFALVNNGYDPNGKAPSFDDDSDEDQTFTIVLEHTYQTINPKHPGKPGQPINQNPHSPKYPSGTDAKSLTIMGTQTIHYVDQNGKQMAPDDTSQHVQFTHEIVIDKVTGQTVADHGWTPASQTYGTVATPVVTGYTADRDIAGGQVATPSDPNREETVYYTAIPTDQKATITYIDDTLKKNLGSDQAQGKVDTTINFTHDVDNQIDNFIHQGYKLVSNGFDHQKFNHDDTKNQFEVHLAHDFKDVARQDPVHEIIHYVYADKTTAAPDATAEVHFVQHGQQDQVTKEVKWAPVKAAEFAAVKSPVIDGYTADQAEIVAVPVHFGDQDTVKTVTYHAGDQKATITYIDRTTGKTLTIRTEVGKANSTIPYQSKADIIGYEDLGYVLDDNQYDAQGTPSFDDDNYIDQNFNIYLKHTYQTINPKHPGKPGQPINKDPNGPKYPSDTDAQSLTITGTQTIHYVDQNGNPVAPDDTSQHVQFTHEIVIDKVTGQRIADHGWTNAQTYQKVKVPTVKGYTADKTVAGGETVTYKRPDSIAYVHYTPIEQQRAQVIYVDQSTGDYLKTVTKTGAAMTTIPYQSKDDLKGYLDAGYVLIKNGYDPVGKAPSFDNQTATDQIFYITLNHNTKETSRQDVVTETIHYIYADGKKAHDDVTVQKHFTQKGTQDLVTKQISWQPVASQQFTSVASPAIDGYHADQPVIPAVIVNYGSPDIVKTVTYTAGDQQATIIYVDDTTGNELNRISENGKSGKQIPYSSKQDLLSYEEQGYVLVTNGYDVNGIPSFDKDENINQIFYINLKHGTQSVTPNNPGNPKEPNIPGKPQHPTDYDPATLEKDVTRTIKYVVNGNHQVPDSIKQTVHFEQKGLYDKVTGEWITPLSWVVDHQVVKGVISPRIAGYRVVSVSGDTTDNQNVNAKTLGPEDSSYIITVTYDSASPTNPTTPTSPTSSTTPTNPTSPTSPTTPTSPMAPTNPTSPTTPTAPTSPVDDTNQPKITPHFVNSNVVHKPTTRMVSQPIDLQQVTTTNQGANVLPQTGNEEVISAAAFGLMGLAMAASIVAGTRKKRHE